MIGARGALSLGWMQSQRGGGASIMRQTPMGRWAEEADARKARELAQLASAGEGNTEAGGGASSRVISVLIATVRAMFARTPALRP